MQHPIAECARGWLGTRFHHQGRLKKTATHNGGVDCLGLLVGVAGELQLKDTSRRMLALADELDYSHQPDTARLRSALERHLALKKRDEMKIGDIVLLRVDDRPQHLGIVSDYPNAVMPVQTGIQSNPKHLDSRFRGNDEEECEAIIMSLGLIHAYAPARAVVEHALDQWWQERIEAIFSVQLFY